MINCSWCWPHRIGDNVANWGLFLMNIVSVSYFYLLQVPVVSAVAWRRGHRSTALLIRHSCSAGLVHTAGTPPPVTYNTLHVYLYQGTYFDCVLVLDRLNSATMNPSSLGLSITSASGGLHPTRTKRWRRRFLNSISLTGQTLKRTSCHKVIILFIILF